MNKPRKGDWFQTFTGQQFWPLDPRPGDFNILDIANGLANTCRFNGHVKNFYSVAQHSVLVSLVVPEELALEGLMHDAAEAYLGDVIRPLKAALPEYKKIEERAERALAQQYGLRFPWPSKVKEADNCLLMTERRDVLPAFREWTWRANPLPEEIIAWAPWRAKEEFLSRFNALVKGRTYA